MQCGCITCQTCKKLQDAYYQLEAETFNLDQGDLC